MRAETLAAGDGSGDDGSGGRAAVGRVLAGGLGASASAGGDGRLEGGSGLGDAAPPASRVASSICHAGGVSRRVS
jgi:hypothetical protein